MQLPAESSRRVTCRYHCAKCGRHMASLEAFDRHLTGPLAARRCIDPNKSATLVPKHTDGVCAIDKYDAATGEPIEVHGITVWQTVAAAESSWAEAA